MYGTKSDQAHSVVLHIVISSTIAFTCQFRATTQATDDKQRQYGETENTRNDGYHNGLGRNCNEKANEEYKLQHKQNIR